MTVKQLARLITQRVIVKSRSQTDPADYIATAIVRVSRIRTEEELIQFGSEYGILSPTLNTEN
jgi:hypothetical protein